MPRKIGNCADCGLLKEIVARDRCRSCYEKLKRKEDAKDDPFHVTDYKLERQRRAEQTKAAGIMFRIVKLCNDMPTPLVAHEDLERVKAILQPYLVKWTDSLGIGAKDDKNLAKIA